MAKYWFSFTPNSFDSPNLSPTFLNFIKFDGTTLTPPGITQPITGTGMYQFTYVPSFSIAFRIDGATTGGGLTTLTRYIINSIDIPDVLDTYVAYGTTLSAIGSTVVAMGATQTAIGTAVTGIGSTLTATGSTLNAYGATQTAQGFGIASISTVLVNTGATVIAIGNTLSALGSTFAVIGDLSARIGTTASVFGTTSTDPVDLYGYAKRHLEFLEGNQTFNKSTGVWSIFSRGFTTQIASKSLANNVIGVTRS